MAAGGRPVIAAAVVPLDGGGGAGVTGFSGGGSGPGTTTDPAIPAGVTGVMVVLDDIPKQSVDVEKEAVRGAR